MRRAFWAAGPVVLALAGATSAQFYPPVAFGPCPGLPFGWYSPFGYSYRAVRITIVVPPPIVVVPREPVPSREPLQVVPRADRELPINPDETLVIRPRPGGLKNLPPPRQVQVPPRLPEPPPKVPGFDVPPRQAPKPADDRLAEHGRQIRLGRAAFAAGEYGRAAERFEQATRVAPDQPLNDFLLAQARYALGKYRDAVASIYAGMRRQPDWPASNFSGRELYGDNAADHALHLERLRAAAERTPDEPALQFLYGYQLWFNGRREEAKPFFRRAAANVADPKPIEQFLNR